MGIVDVIVTVALDLLIINSAYSIIKSEAEALEMPKTLVWLGSLAVGAATVLVPISLYTAFQLFI